MPCNQIREVAVEFTVANIELFKRSLESLGMSARLVNGRLDFSGRNNQTGQWQSGRFYDGKLTHDGSVNTESLKTSYAAQSVKETWSKFGKVTQKSATKFTVQLKAY